MTPPGKDERTSLLRSLASSLSILCTSFSVRCVPAGLRSTSPFVLLTSCRESSMYCHSSFKRVLSPSFHDPRASLPFDRLKYRLLYLGGGLKHSGRKVGLDCLQCCFELLKMGYLACHEKCESLFHVWVVCQWNEIFISDLCPAFSCHI